MAARHNRDKIRQQSGKGTAERGQERDHAISIDEFSDGRFCVDTMLGEHRKRITRTSMDAAKVEAQKLIAQIPSGRSHKREITLAEIDDYLIGLTFSSHSES